MFGTLLLITSATLTEFGVSVGKTYAMAHKESPYTMGFLNLFWAVILFFLFAFFIRGQFIFTLASLPFFLLRIPLEIAQAHATVNAVIKADRSTFSFLRIWTLPLLLIADLALGYTISTKQILGISIIVIGFIILFINHGIKTKGAGFVMFSAINAALTISLFKYNITHFNSVEAEQGIMLLIVLTYFFVMARLVAKERPLVHYLRKPTFFFQSLSMGIASVLTSFAYLFAPASIITTASRLLHILTSIVSGNAYFHEKKPAIKIVAFLFLAIGIVLMRP